MSDVMMFGIAKMPYEMAMDDEMSRRQFYANTQRLVAALEAAREDAERLDWLDTQRGDDVQGSYPEEPQLVGHYWSIDGQCTDVRTAIDAAREARNG